MIFIFLFRLFLIILAEVIPLQSIYLQINCTIVNSMQVIEFKSLQSGSICIIYFNFYPGRFRFFIFIHFHISDYFSSLYFH